MSMIMEYVRLRPHELAELRRLLIEEPDSAYEYAGDLRMGDEDEAVSSRGTDEDSYGRLVALFCAAASDREPIAVWMA